MMIISSIVLGVSFVLLFVGAELFIAGAVAVGKRLGWSPLLVGVILVGWSTAFPEMLVSAVSAWYGQRHLSLGNALGSYITNMSLVLGLSACLRPIVVRRRMIKREFLVLLISLVISYLLMLDGFLSMRDGVLLLLLLFISTGILCHLENSSTTHQADVQPILESSSGRKQLPCASPLKVWGQLLGGLIIVLVASEWMVHAAVSLAHAVHLTPLWMGLVVVSIGTSLPELAASVMGTLRGHADIAVGNVIGSNIFGLLTVLAMPALLAPGAVDPMILHRDFVAMGAVTLLFIACLYQPRYKQRDPILQRWHGMLLLLAFVIYLGCAYWTEHLHV